jgi:hypothetical protein
MDSPSAANQLAVTWADMWGQIYLYYLAKKSNSSSYCIDLGALEYSTTSGGLDRAFNSLLNERLVTQGCVDTRRWAMAPDSILYILPS